MTGFLDHLTQYEIFLGSQSPRRKKLLENARLPFKTWLLNNIDEIFPPDLNPDKVAMYLAEKKSHQYKPYLTDMKILITADTIVHQNGRILGKPADVSEAKSMIGSLSGKIHQVITGICLTSANRSISFCAETEVEFARLSQEEIDYYVTEYKPFDKAGSYGIQEWIGLIGICSIRGSYFNVMGLPVHTLYTELKKFTNYYKS